jgi:hypothetical protein
MSQHVLTPVLTEPDMSTVHQSSSAPRFESFSIGAGWCQALSDYSVDLVWDVQSQGAPFSSGSALGPSHDGITRMRRTNLRRGPYRKTSGRHKDSKRTRLIHRHSPDRGFFLPGTPAGLGALDWRPPQIPTCASTRGLRSPVATRGAPRGGASRLGG